MKPTSLSNRGIVEYITTGWGSQDPGHWRVGTYRVDLFSEGVKVASGSFDIYEKEEKIPEITRPQTRALIQGEEPISGRMDDLKVENGLSVDAVVVVVPQYRPDEVIRAVYIRAGDSFTLIDLRGNAEVYYMTGQDWDAQTKRFLTNPHHRRFDDIFDFSRYIYEITLHPVAGGTAGTKDLQEDEFPALP